MDTIDTRIVESLLLPPGGPVLLGFVGLLLWRLGFGRKLFVFALLLLWLLSLPVTANLLLAGLERYPALSEAQIRTTDAESIVVLGSGRYLDAPEYAEDSVSRNALFRLRYAAWLARRTGLPVIPSGGAPRTSGESEARINGNVLRDEFGVSVEHIEQRSRTTWENARYTAQLMKTLGMQKIILVTDASHMPRAMYAFEHNGVDPLPAPTGFVNTADQEYSWLDILPSAKAMLDCYYALHEYLGLAWYRLK